MPGRVFVAIEMPEAARDLLRRAMDAFLAAEPRWADEKPVSPKLMHVTLAFLGAVPDAILPETIGRLEAAAACARPFALRLSGVRAVPSARRAAMLWATADDGTAQAAGLAAGLAHAADLPDADRPFRAHVTLARARRPRRIAAEAVDAASAVLSGAGQDPDGSVSVRSATLFSSTLGPSGPTYERLALLRLGTWATDPEAD